MILVRVSFRVNNAVVPLMIVWDVGRHNEAAQIVNELVTTPSGFTNVPLLFAYARFGAEYDKIEEPLQALLKAVTIDQGNVRVNAVLSKLLSTERGLMELFKQVPPSGLRRELC
jgi:hypothetical protein